MTQSAKDYLVVGATASPGSDELPQFLDPVCRAPDQEETLFVANVEPWDGSPPGFHPVARQTFVEECEAGNWQRLEPGFFFDWGYQLVVLDADRPPLYLPASDADHVVRKRGEEALEAFASDLERCAVGEESDDRIWYAARALPDDPFPLLALLALERSHISPTLSTQLESELPEQYPGPSPLHQRAIDRRWGKLLGIIRKDAVGEHFLAAAGDLDPVISPDSKQSEASMGSSAGRNVRRGERTEWLKGFLNPSGFLPDMQLQFGRR